MLVIPLLTGAIGALGNLRKVNDAIMAGGLALTFGLCVATAAQFLDGHVPAAFDDALRVDGLSALVLVLCGFVGLLSGVYGIGYVRRNEARRLVTPRMRRKLYGLIPAYVFAMLLVSVSNNLGIMWIAVELTTLASVFLVSYHDRDTSLEAAWKFLMLGSLGLAFALLGTVLLFASGQGLLGEGMSALHWTRFMQVAPGLHPFTLRLGVVFALIGYGTKAGLAPMHTWKPDAYREAPSPAGVLMAVGMLNGAMYCILRIHLISKAAVGPEFSGGLLLTLGLLSVLIATPFILIQWNLKRLLAYSSIEHVGIMAVGVGLGAEAAAFGALLHMTYHSFAKPVAFLLGRHARPASQLVGFRPARGRDVHASADHQRAVRARGGDDHRLAAVRPLLQRDDDPQGRLYRLARDGDVDISGGARRAFLRLRVPGGTSRPWTAPRSR